jgi:integrase
MAVARKVAIFLLMKAQARRRGRKQRSREPIYVIPFKNAGGSMSYRVSGMHQGKQVRENFKTEEEALARRDELMIERANIESRVVRRPTWLSEAQLRDAELAVEGMDGRPVTVAVRFFNENYREPVNKITVQSAYEKFIAEKRLNNLRADSIRNLSVRVGFLTKDHGKQWVSDLLPEHLREIIFTTERSAVTSDNVRRALSSFFTWAVEHKYCALNPMVGIKPVKLERDEPEILTVGQARCLVEKAAEYKEGVVLPYVALGLFAGIRPRELARLTWDCIDLEAGTVTIGAKLAKMRQWRIVEMVCVTEKDGEGKEVTLPANLIGWLLPHALKKTPLRGVNWRKDFDAVKLAAGLGTKSEAQPELKPWTQDILRHTAISNHLAYLQHEGKTAAWAGNSPDIVQRHYKGLVKPAEAAEFWGIIVGQAENKVAVLNTAPRAWVAGGD